MQELLEALCIVLQALVFIFGFIALVAATVAAFETGDIVAIKRIYKLHEFKVKALRKHRNWMFISLAISIAACVGLSMIYDNQQCLYLVPLVVLIVVVSFLISVSYPSRNPSKI